MVYVDTSVLAAYYCPEPLSRKSEAFLTTHSRPAVSNLTEVEMISALSRKVREGGLNREDASGIAAKFFSHLNARFFTRLSIESHHYVLARDWIGQFTAPLRSLDALHLAVASSNEMTFVTADERLAHSAELLALDVLLIKAE